MLIGSKAYKLTPEQNLIALSHYLDALELQRDLAKALAIFGGKIHIHNLLVVGGVTCVQDIEILLRIAGHPTTIERFKSLLKHIT